MPAPLIQAMAREGKRKSELRRIRAAGDIPAVLYGKGVTAVPIALSGAEYREKIVGRRMIQVDFAGQKIPAMVQDVARHPVDRRVMHMDLRAISLEEVITTHLPLHLHGLEEVEKRAGIIQLQVQEVEVEGYPAQIPDYLPLNISNLELGDSLRMRDILLPAGLVLRSDPDEVVVSVVLPKHTVTENPADPEAVPAVQTP